MVVKTCCVPFSFQIRVFQLAHAAWQRPLEAVALGRRDRDFVLALVVARNERHAHDLADRHGAADDRDGQQDDQELEPQRASQDPAVAAVDEPVDEPRLRLAADGRGRLRSVRA